MRRSIWVLLVLLLTTTAANAGDWLYEDADVPIAYFDNGAAQLQFACRGGDLAMGFWVRSPHRQVAAAAAMSVAITPDPAGSAATATTAGTSFAQELPLIHSDGTSVIVRGPVARQWARIAQRAKTTMRVSYVRTKAGGGLEVFDGNDFGANASAATIQNVLDRCG